MKRIASVKKQPTAIFAFQRITEFNRILGEVLRMLEQQPRLIHHPLADRRQGDAARMMANEEIGTPISASSSANRAGNRGLRHIEPLGRIGDMTAIGGGHHIPKLDATRGSRIPPLHQKIR